MAMRYKFVHVTLTNPSSEQLKLTYEVRAGDLGQIWADAIAKAKDSGLREKERFYGFRATAEDFEKILSLLEDTIRRLQQYHPELNIPQLDRSNLPDSINNLHTNFADSHLISHRVIPETEKLWSDF